MSGQEAQLLQGGQGSAADSEEPAGCGSNTDKLCLLPFFAVVAALVYYGVQGVQQFNIYQYGEAQAKVLCEPLSSIQEKCRGDFQDEVAKAVDAGRGPAVTSLRDSTHAALDLHSTVVDACTGVESGLGKCDIVKGFVSKGRLLHLPSGLASLDVPEGSGDVIDAHALKSKAKSITSSVKKSCGSISEDIDSMCTKLSKATTSVEKQVDAALQALTDDAPKKVEEAMLKSLAESSKAICPAFKAVPKACGSLKDAVKDALSKAENAAADKLPKEVPRELLLDALNTASHAATSHVDGICKDSVDITEDCPKFFAADQWRPLVVKVREPLQALRSKLNGAAGVLKKKVATQCTTAASLVQKTCNDAVGAAGAAASQAEKVASDASAEKLKDIRKGIAEKVKAVHDELDDKLRKASQSLELVVQGCSQVEELVKTQCNSLRNATTSFNHMSTQLDGGLQKVFDAGEQSDRACKEIGKLQNSCLAVANPSAVLAKGATGLWQHRSSEIVQLECYLLIGCSIMAVFMMGVIKWATKVVVIISILLNLGAVFAIAMMNLAVMNLPGAAFFGIVFVLKSCWFWCIRHKFEFAVALIHCGVQTVENKMGVGAWLLGIFLIAMQAGCLVLTGGAWYFLMGTNAPPEAQQLMEISPMLIPVLLVFSLAWTVEVIANLLHVMVCCSLGAACGIRTPAKSVCGSFCFAVTGALGSVCVGSFLIAVLKALQYAYEKGTNSKNPCVQVIVRVACCVLEWILKLFNGYAFVFVGLKGSSYCDAARRTVEAFSKDGMAAIATDEALHDVLHIAKMVSMWAAVLMSLIFGSSLDLIGFTQRSWQEVFTGPVLCVALAVVTSSCLSLVMGRLLEAAVCTLFIVYDDEKYQQCMKASLPDVFNELQAVCEEKRNSFME